MAAGFRSPLPHLGISASPVTEQGGFRTPLPGWNAGGTVTGEQGGFRTPLPGWNAGATPGVTQGGYRSMLGFWAGGMSGGIVLPPAEVSEGGPSGRIVEDIYRDDEEILAIITMFMRTIH